MSRRTAYPNKAPALTRTTCKACGEQVDTFIDDAIKVKRVLDVGRVMGDLNAAARRRELWVDKGPYVGWCPVWRLTPELLASFPPLRLTHTCAKEHDTVTTTETEADAFGVEDLLRRDRYDRPLIIPPEGGDPVPYTRASTFCAAIKDSAGIAKWKMRHLALGIGRHEDLAAMAAGLKYGDKELDEIIATAVDRAGTNAKANWGTAMHKFTEREDADPFVPERMREDVEAYRAAVKRAGIEVVSSERFVVCDELKAAGTYDHIYRVPAELFPPEAKERGHTGRKIHVIGDKKTGTLHPYEHAVQLAVYAHSKHYDPATGKREDLGVNLDWALLAHIPAGKGEAVLYWIDIRVGREGAGLALQVRDYRARKGLATAIDDLEQRLAESVEQADKPYCSDCDHDTHRCNGCGEPLEHGVAICAGCKAEQQHDNAAELVKSELNGRELTPEERLTEALRVAVSITALTTLWRTRKAIWTAKHTELAAERRALIEAGKV